MYCDATTGSDVKLGMVVSRLVSAWFAKPKTAVKVVLLSEMERAHSGVVGENELHLI